VYIDTCNFDGDPGTTIGGPKEGPRQKCCDISIRFYFYNLRGQAAMPWYVRTNKDILGRCLRHVPIKVYPDSPYEEISREEALVWEIMDS
jgi:hypothetical protein